MKLIIPSILTLALMACSTPTTGVVPRGDGYYTVTRQGDSFMVSTDSLKTAALKEAGDRCDSMKKPLKVVHAKEIPAGPLGRWPEAEIVFRCE